MEVACENTGRMGIKEYFETLIGIIRSPARYFESTAQETGSRRALFFLMISGIFYCSVSMTYFFDNSLAMGVIMMVNAVCMPALGALFTFILTGMTSHGRVPFGRVFNVYAYASGAVMVISWIPGLAMVLEPLRAVLVGVGLVKACGLGPVRATVVVILTAVMLLLFFWTLAPVVVGLRGLLG
jgi:hypothetical protein